MLLVLLTIRSRSSQHELKRTEPVPQRSHVSRGIVPVLNDLVSTSPGFPTPASPISSVLENCFAAIAIDLGYKLIGGIKHDLPRLAARVNLAHSPVPCVVNEDCAVSTRVDDGREVIVQVVAELRRSPRLRSVDSYGTAAGRRTECSFRFQADRASHSDFRPDRIPGRSSNSPASMIFVRRSNSSKTNCVVFPRGVGS